MAYTVTAVGDRGVQSRTCLQASEAHVWVEAFRDDGADDIVVERYGVPVTIDQLFRLMFEKTRSCEGCR